MNPRGCETDAGRSAGLAGLDVQLVFTYALTTAQSPSMMTSMDRPSDQLQYPRASVSSVRVTAPASPEMYHRPFQTPRTSTSSPALSREHSARPSPVPTTTPLPPFPDHPVHLAALNSRLSKEATPTVFGLPLKYVS